MYIVHFIVRIKVSVLYLTTCKKLVLVFYYMMFMKANNNKVLLYVNLIALPIFIDHYILQHYNIIELVSITVKVYKGCA